MCLKQCFAFLFGACFFYAVCEKDGPRYCFARSAYHSRNGGWNRSNYSGKTLSLNLLFLSFSLSSSLSFRPFFTFFTLSAIFFFSFRKNASFTSKLRSSECAVGTHRSRMYLNAFTSRQNGAAWKLSRQLLNIENHPHSRNLRNSIFIFFSRLTISFIRTVHNCFPNCCHGEYI